MGIFVLFSDRATNLRFFLFSAPRSSLSAIIKVPKKLRDDAAPRLNFFAKPPFAPQLPLSLPWFIYIMKIKMHQATENKFAFYFNLICWTSFAPCRRKPDHWKSFCGGKSETNVTLKSYGQNRTRNHLETYFWCLCVTNCDTY